MSLLTEFADAMEVAALRVRGATLIDYKRSKLILSSAQKLSPGAEYRTERKGARACIVERVK